MDQWTPMYGTWGAESHLMCITSQWYCFIHTLFAFSNSHTLLISFFILCFVFCDFKLEFFFSLWIHCQTKLLYTESTLHKWPKECYFSCASKQNASYCEIVTNVASSKLPGHSYCKIPRAWTADIHPQIILHIPKKISESPHMYLSPRGYSAVGNTTICTNSQKYPCTF